MRIRAIIIVLLGVAVLLAANFSHSQGSAPSESRVKAAFIYNFAKFIDWPALAFADDKAPFVIGVLGENTFGEDLQVTVREKQINNHPILVKTGISLTEARECQLLFVSVSEKDKSRLAEIFQNLRGKPVLTVGDLDRFVESGGMIGFVVENNKMRFQINDEAAKAAGLKISSKLMSLALPGSR